MEKIENKVISKISTVKKPNDEFFIKNTLGLAISQIFLKVSFFYISKHGVHHSIHRFAFIFGGVRYSKLV
jgi:hypothetical protein